MQSKSVFANIGLLYSAAIWGSTFFIVKNSLEGIDPVYLVALRFSIAAIALGIPLFIQKRSFRSGIKEGAILGFFIWALYITQTIGLKYTSAANSGFITGLFVAFVPVVSIFMFRRIPAWNGLTAIAVSLLGLWVLTGGLQDINNGDLLTLVAALTYALHILFADRYVKNEIDPYVLNFYQFLFVGIASFAVVLILDLPMTIGSGSILRAVIFLAIFPTLLAFVIQLAAQRHVSPVRVALILAFEPVFAGLFAWTLGNEPFMLSKAAGGFLIFLALVISAIPAKTKQVSSR